MTDMEKIAERLRNSRTPEGFAEVYGAFLDGAHCDEQEALIDWLAERDRTPLTPNMLVELGISLTNGIVSSWFIAGYGRGPISTVGELRTLARLAGVELKQPESTPMNR